MGSNKATNMSDFMTHFENLYCNESDFSKAVGNAFKNESYRVVAMVGAGLSVPSGIPATTTLNRYLAYCVWKALKSQPDDKEHWEPRTQDWPQVGEVPSDFDAWEKLQVLLNEARRVERMELVRILQLACGAVADWLSALHFLTRLTFEERVEGNQRRNSPLLTAPQDAVIDQFFSQLVANRQTSLGHRMLVQLARRLRMDLILTTNFDHLIENAFSEAGAKIEPFEVHREAGLPPASLVNKQRSLIKLHGGRYGLRADFSLDAMPSETDSATFVSYLAKQDVTADQLFSPSGTQTKSNPDLHDSPIALLVAGISASDRRIVRLLESALTNLPHLRIYWVFHSATDRAALNRLLAREPWRRTTCENSRRFWFTQHTDLGLLFLQLYQECVGTLPPYGIMYPVPWNMPYPPQIPEPMKPVDDAAGDVKARYSRLERLRSEVRRDVESTFRGMLEPGDKAGPFIVHILNAKRSVYGAPTACASLFNENPWSAGRVWLDLEDIAEPAGTFLRLVLAIKRLSGNPNPVSGLDLDYFYQDSMDDFVEALVAEFKDFSGGKWVIFLNGRQQPGKHPLVESEERAGRGQERSWKKPDNQARFWEVLHRLSERLTQRPQRQKLTWVVISSEDHLVKPKRNTSRTITLETSCVEFNPETARNAADAWANDVTQPCGCNSAEDIRRTKFCLLYILSRFRLTRYTGIIKEILMRWLGQGPQCKDSEAMLVLFNNWIQDLVKLSVIRTKPGGFIWMDHQVRTLLRSLVLKEIKAIRSAGNEERTRICRDDLLLLNAHVARSFGRLLLASGDPLAAFECVQHVFDVLARPPLKHASPNSPEAARRLELVLHATLVFRTATGLITRRLSEQFSHYFLRALRRLAERALKRATTQRDESLQQALGNLLARIIGAELHVCEVLEQHDRIGKLHRRLWDHSMFESPKLLTVRQEVRDALQLSDAAAHIGLRHYENAHKQLTTFLEGSLSHLRLPVGLNCVAWQPRQAAPKRPAWSPDDEARLWTQRTYFCESDEVRRRRVQAARRIVYLYIHVAYAEYLNSYQSEDEVRRKGRTEPKNLCRERSQCVLEWAAHYCQFALGILRGVMPEDDAFVYRENARLRAHLALIKARLARQLIPADKPRAQRLVQEAEVHLIDAEAFVEEFPSEGDGLTKAVIELRRAEIILIDVGTRQPVRELRFHLRERLGMEQELVNIPRPQPDGIAGRLEDATRALRRAERCLKDHPNSIWWLEILTVLKLKCYEYVCAYDLLRVRTITSSTDSSMYCERAFFGDLASDVRSNLQFFRRDDVFHLARATDAVARTYWTLLHISQQLSPPLVRSEGRFVRETEAQLVCLKALRLRLAKSTEIAKMADCRILDYAHDTLLDTHDFEVWYGRVMRGH